MTFVRSSLAASHVFGRPLDRLEFARAEQARAAFFGRSAGDVRHAFERTHPFEP